MANTDSQLDDYTPLYISVFSRVVILTRLLFQVVMKIIKHSSQLFPTIATGSLVGMDVGGTLEVTNTFPFPIVELPPASHFNTTTASSNTTTAATLAQAAPRAKANTAYQAEMIRMLREVNIDAQNVGWYTSTNMGNFVNLNVIENQYFYQKELNEHTVALVHDVSRSSQGSLSLRAFRLSPQFMTAFKESKFTSDQCVNFPLLFLVFSPWRVRNPADRISSPIADCKSPA
jgi:translation initiation factor 3 subunit H